MRHHLMFLFRLLYQPDPVVVGIAADYVEEYGLWSMFCKWSARLKARKIRRYEVCGDGVHDDRRGYRRLMRVMNLHERFQAVLARQ